MSGKFSAFLLFCSGAVLAGCARPEDRAERTGEIGDTAAAVAETGATISLANLAGKWRIRSTDERGGTPVEVEMTATADTSGWFITGPNKKKIPVRVVAVSGDSIVTEAGPYESFIRKGVQVQTRTVNRLQGDKLVGTTEARYSIRGRDSVAMRNTEGTRLQ
jgi:hypothetical protein